MALSEVLLLSVESLELGVGLEEGGRGIMDGGGLENGVFIGTSGSVGMRPAASDNILLAGCSVRLLVVSGESKAAAELERLRKNK